MLITASPSVSHSNGSLSCTSRVIQQVSTNNASSSHFRLVMAGALRQTRSRSKRKHTQSGNRTDTEQQNDQQRKRCAPEDRVFFTRGRLTFALVAGHSLPEHAWVLLHSDSSAQVKLLLSRIRAAEIARFSNERSNNSAVEYFDSTPQW